MFNNIGRKLASTLSHIIARRAIAPAQVAPQAELVRTKNNGKSGKVSHKRGNAAQLKRASKKANNIRKFN